MPLYLSTCIWWRPVTGGRHLHREYLPIVVVLVCVVADVNGPRAPAKSVFPVFPWLGRFVRVS